MELHKNAVSWVEIPVTDFQRAKKFYSTIFNYEMPEMEMGPNKMGFLLFDQENGGVGGAIVQGSKGYTPTKHGVKIYLNGGSDLNNVLNRVDAAGGKITLPKTPIGENMGYMGFFTDLEGNEIGLHSNN
ncbi:MAG: VOC family protein [Saprospiraceae bacterium]|nr:VOC family protein [Saprospiraceae bacterium]